MKLLLEPSFPKTEVSLLRGKNWSFVRSEAADKTDAELIVSAAAEGFAAVGFVGRQAIARPELIRAAIDAKISILVTETGNPLEAIRYLEKNLGRLRKLLPEKRLILLQSNQAVELDPEEMLEQREAWPLFLVDHGLCARQECQEKATDAVQTPKGKVEWYCQEHAEELRAKRDK